MPTLHELQADFRDYLLGGEAGAIEAAVARDGLPAAQLLQIYRNHVRISLREALKATFPTVASLVGEEFFAGLARAFIETAPPHSPVLAEYGVNLPAFIEEFPPAAATPYLADAARLDWALNASFHAPELPPLEVAALAGIAPENLGELRLQLQPSLRFLRSAYPLDRIWEASQPDAPQDLRVDLAAGSVDLEIRRRGEQAVFAVVSPATWRWRLALAEGAGLAQALASVENDAAFDLPAELAALFAAGLVCGLAPPAV